MSISLPQELQTRKVKSLPKETRKLVDELLAEKFDIREEVVPQRDDYFRQEYTPRMDWRAGPAQYTSSGTEFDASNVHRRRGAIQLGVNHETRKRMARITIRREMGELRDLEEALHQLDMEGIPYAGRKIFISNYRLDYLIRNIKFSISMNVNTRNPQYNGCDVIVTPDHREEYVYVEF